MSKKALLMILDVWGIGNHSHADVIYNTPTPYWDYLLKTYPHSQLQASGENVGLPDGQMGKSEVGQPHKVDILTVVTRIRERRDNFFVL